MFLSEGANCQVQLTCPLILLPERVIEHRDQIPARDWPLKVELTQKCPRVNEICNLISG